MLNNRQQNWHFMVIWLVAELLFWLIVAVFVLFFSLILYFAMIIGYTYHFSDFSEKSDFMLGASQY